jgi:hypothetical protein
LERVVVLRKESQITIPALVLRTMTPDKQQIESFRLYLNPEKTITLEPIFVEKKEK